MLHFWKVRGGASRPRSRSNRTSRRESCRRRVLRHELLEPRQLLAALQILSTPKVFSSGWAVSSSEREMRIEEGRQTFEWYGDVFASPPNFNINHPGSGAARMSGPLTFRVVPSEPSELGTLVKATVHWDYSLEWDLDPLIENRVYARAAMPELGEFFDFEDGTITEEDGSFWLTADNGGFPIEADHRFLIVEVGRTYSISLSGGIEARGLWNGGTDTHGTAGLSAILGVSIETDEPDISVTLEGLDRGGAKIEYAVANWQDRESTIELYWAKVARTASGLATIGGPIYTIDVDGTDELQTITVPAIELPQAPRGAQYLVAIADRPKQITELDETNNFSSVPISPDLEVEIEFLGPSEEEQSLNPFCTVCTFPVVSKGEVYRLVANVTNHQSVYPLTVEFGYTEQFDGEAAPNLSPGLANRIGIKPTRVASGQTVPVILDPIRKTWDWIPRDNPFTNPPWGSFFSTTATVSGELSDALQETSAELNGPAGKILKHAGPLSTVLDAVALLWAASQVDPQVDLRYRVTALVDDVLWDDDSEILRVEVPDVLKTKLAGSAVLAWAANYAQASAVGAAITGAGLPVALVLLAASSGLQAEADLLYEQAFDPPDPDYQRFAAPQFDPVDSELSGFERQIAELSQARLRWLEAESASRDRAYGARDADDLEWYVDQLVSASGLALGGAGVDLRMILQQSLLDPLRQRLGSDPAAFAAQIENGFPEQVTTMLRDHGGMTDAEIEAMRVDMLDAGAAAVFANTTALDIRRTSGLTAVRTSLQELIDAVEIRFQQLGQPEFQPPEQLANQLWEFRSAVQEMQTKRLPSAEMIRVIEGYISTAHQLALQTNDWQRYDEQLEQAHAAFERLLLHDFSPASARTLLEQNESAMSTDAAARVEQELLAMETALADLEFGAARQAMLNAIVTMETYTTSGEIYDPSLAEELTAFLELLASTIDGSQEPPLVVRPPSPIRVYQDGANQQVDLNRIALDPDSGEPLQFRVISNSMDSLVEPTIDEASQLTLAFQPEATGTAEIGIEATDADGETVVFWISTIVYPAMLPLDILPVTDQQIVEGDAVDVTIDAGVIDEFYGRTSAEEPLSYAVVSDLPGGATIDADGRFLWITDDTLGGQTFEVTVQVTRHGEIPTVTPVTFSVTVEEWSRPPVLTPLEEHHVVVGEPIEIGVTAIDYDIPAEAIHFALENAPAGMEIDPSTGALHWTPPSPGTYQFDVLATDDHDGTDQQTVVIRAYAGSLPPRDIDLSVAEMRLEQPTAAWGGSVDLTTTIRNTGTSASGPYEIGWYLISSSGGEGQMTPLMLESGESVLTVDDLAASTVSDPFRIRLKLPASMPPTADGDTWSITARVDPRNLKVESNEANNGASGSPFLDTDSLEVGFAGVNLIGSRVSSLENELRWGDSFSLSVDITNTGVLPSGAFDVQWYLSADPNGSAEDVLLPLIDGSTRVRVGEILAGESLGASTVQLALPSRRPAALAAGELWVIMKVDAANEIAEANETDNFAHSEENAGWMYLPLLQPDLRVDVFPTNTSVAWGDSVSVYTTVTNDGNGPSPPSSVSWYLTDDPTGQSHLIPLLPIEAGVERFAALEAYNGSETHDFNIQLPDEKPTSLAGNRFWIVALVDGLGEIDEADEANNRSVPSEFSSLLIAGDDDHRPDLEGYLSIAEPFTWNAELAVSMGVSNAGNSDAGEFNVAWFLSTDSVLSPDDIALRLASGDASYHASALAAGQFLEPQIDVRLQIPPADSRWYSEGAFLIAIIDSTEQVDERYEFNNSLWNPITALPSLPNLNLGVMNLDLPTATRDRREILVAEWGESVPMEQSLWNSSSAAVSDVEVRWYLSRDSQVSTDDVVLDRDSGDASPVPKILANESVALDGSLVLPESIPEGWEGNDFFIISVADPANTLIEPREDDNIQVAAIHIGPSPLPDLRSAYAYAPQAPLRWGETVAMTTEIQNAGNAPADQPFAVRWYLSPDEFGSSDDILLSLDDGATSRTVDETLDGRGYFGEFAYSRYSMTGPIDVLLHLPDQRPTSWQGDQYYIIVRTDTEQTIAEFDESNNFGGSGDYLDFAPITIDSGPSWQCPNDARDVTGDGLVSPLDALVVINLLNRGRPDWIDNEGRFRRERHDEPYYDVNGNGFLSPLDAIIVINSLNRAAGEGEGSTALVLTSA